MFISNFPEKTYLISFNQQARFGEIHFSKKPSFSKLLKNNFMKSKLVIPFLLFIAACGGRDKVVVKDGEVSVTDLPKVAEKMTEGVKQAQDRWAERKAKGDTLAMPYKDLQAYLPDVSGYTKEGGPKGSQVNMPGMGSWSQTDQAYTNGEK